MVLFDQTGIPSSWLFFISKKKLLPGGTVMVFLIVSLVSIASSYDCSINTSVETVMRDGVNLSDNRSLPREIGVMKRLQYSIVTIVALGLAGGVVSCAAMGMEEVMVPMRDGVRLQTRIWKPVEEDSPLSALTEGEG